MEHHIAFPGMVTPPSPELFWLLCHMLLDVYWPQREAWRGLQSGSCLPRTGPPSAPPPPPPFLVLPPPSSVGCLLLPSRPSGEGQAPSLVMGASYTMNLGCWKCWLRTLKPPARVPVWVVL